MVFLLEFNACVELYGERAEIVAAHILAGILASLILCDKFRTADCALGTLLVEDVNDADTETQILVHIPVDTTECLPVAVEVECLLKVSVCLVMSYLGSSSMSTCGISFTILLLALTLIV